MKRVRWIAWFAVALAVGLVGFAGWIYSLPPAPQGVTAPAIPAEEVRATLEALRPPKRARPLVAVLGINEATEVTDYLMPTGILRRADVADVVMLATQAGPVRLYPALSVEPDSTIAAFDAQHPDGADYVIVPAMEPNTDPAALEWIRQQAASGAKIVSVCAGATVIAEAGLLDGKRATTHWYYLADMLERHPAIAYVPDRRFVVDGAVATTTGITASMPTTLALIEAIAGRARAEAVARDLGVEHWDARHASAAFRFNRTFATTVLANALAFWNREEVSIELVPGVDEVSVALVADAWSRTYRSRAVTYGSGADPIVTRGGVRLVPDRPMEPGRESNQVRVDRSSPAAALHEALRGIASRYGERTRDAVAMQLEYAGR